MSETVVRADAPSPEAVEAAWRHVQLARHPQRPRTLDLVPHIFDGFFELHGDRAFGDDPAIVGGPALLDGRPVMIVGHQKGTDTESNIARNFGSPYPEGFRKAQRLMRLADKLGIPIVTFLDTAGAFPGTGSRGARPGRGHRLERQAHDRAPGADRRRRARRGRLGWSARHRGRRRRPGARELGVLGDQPGGRLLDPVALP